MQRNIKTSKGQTAALFTGLALISILYFSFPCHVYLSDGLKTAIQMRDSGGLHVHPNHILYPLLPGLIYRALGGKIVSDFEIEILLLWSLLAGIVACAGLVLSLRARSLSVAATLISLGLFAFFKAVWYLSVIPSPSSNALAAQVCGLTAIVLVSRSLPAGPSRTDVAIMSVFSALAILGSQLNVVLIPIAAVVIYLGAKPKSEKHKDLFVYLAITLAIVLGVSIFCGVALAGVRSLGGFITWQHSYVYDSRWWVHGIDDAIYWNWAGLNETILAFPFRLDTLYGNWMIEFPEPNFWWRLLIRSGQALAMIFLFIETVRAAVSYIKGTVRTFIQTVGLIAALPLIVFLSFWTTVTIHYRVLYLPGLILFLAPSIERNYSLSKFNFKRALPAIIGVFMLFASNFVLQFLPQSFPANNPHFQEILFMRDYVDPGDVIIYSGSPDGAMRSLYADYFLQCDSIRLNVIIPEIRDNPDEVRERLLSVMEAGKQVLVDQHALFPGDSIDYMSEQYHIDVAPNELMNFLDTWAVPNGEIQSGNLLFFKLSPVPDRFEMPVSRGSP